MKYRKIFTLLLICLLFSSSVFAGAMTTNGWFYKPSYGEKGSTAYNLYSSALDASDALLTALSALINDWVIEDNIVTLVTATPTYSSGAAFTLPGDYTSRFTVGKVVQAQVAAGMVYSTVASSSYAAATTTVNLNDSVLTNPITRVYVVATRDGLWPNGPGYVVAADYGTDQAALAAADTVAAAAGKQLLIGRTYSVTSDLTLTSKTRIMPGAIITVGTGQTLTMPPPEAGPYQIFTLTGTGAVALNGAQEKAFSAWFPGADIGAKINNAVAAMGATTTVPIIVTADEWCGESYATGIVVNKPVWIQFPGTRNGAAIYTGSTSAIKLTAHGARVTGFHADLSGNANTGVDGFVIYGVSDCLVDGGVRVQYNTAGGGAVRRWFSIDAAGTGAYQNIVNGLMRLEAPTPTAANSGAMLWLGSSGVGQPNANQIQHVILSGLVPDSGYGVDFHSGLNNHIGQLYVNGGGATSTGIWLETTVGAYNHYIGTCTIDSGVLGTGIKLDAGFLHFSNLFNNCAGTKTTIAAGYDIHYSSSGGTYSQFLSTKQIIPKNESEAPTAATATPMITSSILGGVSPYDQTGNLIIVPRTSVGASRDVVFLTGQYGVNLGTTLIVSRYGGLRGLRTTNGPVGSGTLDNGGGTTTVISNTNVTASSLVFIFPSSANAAAAVGNAAGVYVSAKSAGASFTLTHPASPGASATFNYLILN